MTQILIVWLPARFKYFVYERGSEEDSRIVTNDELTYSTNPFQSVISNGERFNAPASSSVWLNDMKIFTNEYQCRLESVSTKDNDKKDISTYE